VKFFTVKQLLFVLVLLTALMSHWFGGSPHWRGEGPCLVLRPGGALVDAMLGLC
jgi:hypothetical protein